MKLTPEQQKDIENSLWVVNLALKKHNLGHNNDMRQETLLFLCKCRLKFNENNGAKWTTYAYKSAYFFIKRKKKKEQERKSKTIDKDIFDLNLGVGGTEDYICDKILYQSIIDNLSPKDAKTWRYKQEGYKSREIIKILNLSSRTIQKSINLVKSRCKRIERG